MKKPPIIIIGMGRSGTSIVAKVLTELGLFTGNAITKNTYEAKLFQKINKWVFSLCGGGLQNPSSILWLLEDTEVRSIVVQFVRFILRTPIAKSYMGYQKYLRYKTPENFDFPWGWKDPRTTFTLPMWLEIFPKGKIIHVYRHGVDVAKSLKERRDRVVSKVNERIKKYRSLYHFLWLLKYPRKTKEMFDVRSNSLESSFSMWEEYIRQSRLHVDIFRQKALEVKFEDLLENPIRVLREMAEFCDLKVTDASLSSAALHLNRSRAYAYRSSPDLKQFAQKMSSRLSEHGY